MRYFDILRNVKESSLAVSSFYFGINNHMFDKFEASIFKIRKTSLCFNQLRLWSTLFVFCVKKFSKLYM